MALVEGDRISKANIPGTLDKRGSMIPPVTLRTPERNPRKNRGRNLLAVGAVGVLVAGAGITIFNSQEQGGPQPTENPGGIIVPTEKPIPTPLPTKGPVEFTPAPTESPTTKPTPEVTPSPTPTPEATPIPNIEKVIVKGGYIDSYEDNVKPYVSATAKNMTVVAKEYNNNGDLISIALTSEGSKITKNNCYTIQVGTQNGTKEVKPCDYKGVTIWFNISDKILIGDASRGYRPFGSGRKLADEQIQVGEELPSVLMPINIALLQDYMTQKQINSNLKNWNKFTNSIGKSSKRSDHKFTFYTSNIDLVPNN